MEYNIIGSWICSKYKIYVCIKFRCVHFFSPLLVRVFGFNCIRHGQWLSIRFRTINPWLAKYNYMNESPLFSASVGDSFFFDVPLKCNEEDESRICECRMQCKQGTVNMKIRLSTMSEQRALTWRELFARSLCPLKCEVQREIYADGRYTNTHTHAIIKYTHAFIASIGPFFPMARWMALNNCNNKIYIYVCMCNGSTGHTLNVEKLTRSGLSAKVATLFNFLIWFSNRRVPCYPSLALVFVFFSVHRFAPIFSYNRFQFHQRLCARKLLRY